MKELDGLFHLYCGLLLVALLVVAAVWCESRFVPGRLTRDDVDRYMIRVAMLGVSTEAQPDVARKIRAWAEADDGDPVYVVNPSAELARRLALPGASQGIVLLSYSSRRAFLDAITDDGVGRHLRDELLAGVVLVSNAGY